jgi:PAS domain S-box-containing protein
LSAPIGKPPAQEEGSSSSIQWEGNEFLELAEASAGIGVWDVDLATGMVRGRPQFFRLMGLEPTSEAVPIATMRNLRHPDDRAGVISGFRHALQSQTDYYESEYRILWPDGQSRWILGRGRIVRDEHGKPVRYSGVDIDITERKRYEQALRAAEARFLHVFQLAPIAMSISTLRDGRYIDVNTALLAQTGYSRDEIIGRTARDIVTYADPEDFLRVRQLLQHGVIRNLEIALRGKHDIRTVLFNADIIELEGVECLLTASVDITERKAVEAALAESEQRYRDLVDNANDIVATLDLEGRFTSINPAAQRILGYAPEELLGMSLNTLIPPEERPMHEAMLRRKLEGEAATRYEMHIATKGGRRVTLEVNSKLIRAEGKPVAIHSISRDVTERRDADARQTVLIRELQHRAKNLLAVTQSIVLSSLRNASDTKVAQDTILGRFQALARAQEFIAAGPTGGAPIDEIVRAELSAFGGRATIDGPSIIAGSAFAQMFAIVVHELATNATKYGSLSVPQGRVEIRWAADHGGAFRFTWVERGGPPARSPRSVGFGTQIMRAALAAEPRMLYADAGFEYEVTVPMAQLK